MPVLSLLFHLKYVCTVDFKVASSIYRKPWLIEPQSAISLVDLLEQIKAGTNKFEKPESTQQKLFANESVAIAPDNVFDAKTHAGYEGKQVAIVPITGALMKENFCGWFGTGAIRNELNKIKSTSSVKTILLLIDSPGGTVDGTQALAEAILTAQQETIAVVDGMAASAAYWIASAADRIVATSQTDIVGSIGTMISFYDRSQYLEDNGIVLREYHADASKDKNKMMRQAMKGDGKLLIKEMLNPTNDLFLAAVKNHRQGRNLNEEETLTGKTFLADQAKALGLIDEVSSFDNIMNQLLQKNNAMKFSLKTTFKNILSFLGITPEANAESVELTDDQLNQIEAALPELKTTKEKVTQLEGQIQEKDQKISSLENEKTQLNQKIEQQRQEIERLGKLDAGKTSQPKAKEDKHVDNGEEKVDAMNMDFQKNLMNKAL